KGALETAELIKQELNEPKAHVASIGLAGENRVYFASIEQGRSSASRLGIGAVMGDKGVKAIAVRGTGEVNIARPAEFLALCNDVLEYIQYRNENPIKGVPAIFGSLGFQEMAIHDEKWHVNAFAWGNARHRRKGFWTDEVEKEWTEVTEKVRVRLISCHNCPMKCGATMRSPGIHPYMMKCYSKLTYTMAAMSDLNFGFKIAGLAQEYGVDGYTTPQVMALAVELYEAGILTDEDMPGFPSTTEERHFWLLDKIVRREGIGDVLADGVYWATRQIGSGAEAYDHNTIKKHEQIPIKLGTMNPIFFLLYSTGEKINITQIEGQVPQAPFPRREQREEFVKDWIQVPDEKFKEWFLNWEPDSPAPYYPSMEIACELVDWQETMHYIDDALGLCTGLSSFPMKPPYHIHNLPLIISAATGLDVDEAGLRKITRRNRNLIRAINVRRGMRRKDEKPPEDHWKKRFPEYESKLLDEYYKYRGWNREGIPTRATLQALDLDYVSEDLIERGILTDNEAAPSLETPGGKDKDKN
ncbi:MAG: aldehyde dehydrogenase, partial [Deltaproteobacteria bacterium]|nr:aldehyde dehydrogenase [Deltaproteobacteria bacterium]